MAYRLGMTRSNAGDAATPEALAAVSMAARDFSTSGGGRAQGATNNPGPFRRTLCRGRTPTRSQHASRTGRSRWTVVLLCQRLRSSTLSCTERRASPCGVRSTWRRCRLLEQALDAAIRDTAGAFVLDLCDVDFIDSSGSRLILRARALLAREDRALAIVCPPGPVRRLFELVGIADLLFLYASRREAAAALVPTD